MSYPVIFIVTLFLIFILYALRSFTDIKNNETRIRVNSNYRDGVLTYAEYYPEYWDKKRAFWMPINIYKSDKLTSLNFSHYSHDLEEAKRCIDNFLENIRTEAKITKKTTYITYP